MTTLVEMQNATIYEQQKDLDTKDAEIAELKKEITLLKVGRDNANQHNSIMRQEAMGRKREIAELVKFIDDAEFTYAVDQDKAWNLINKHKKEW